MVAPGMSVAVSPRMAGARPVAITIVAHYEMQCGWPGPGELVVRFPTSMQIPATLAAGSATVDGTPVTPVVASRALRSVAVALPKRPQIMCEAIGPGTLTVSFTRGARLGSPTKAGTYLVRATHGVDSFTGRLTITR